MVEFLRAASGRRFQFGNNDCLMWLADWIAARTGNDPAAEWRGRYRTPLGAARILRRRGGPVAHLAAILEPKGFFRTETPQRGDVAIVDAPEGLMGAIVLGASVACCTDRGVILRRLPIIAAWSV